MKNSFQKEFYQDHLRRFKKKPIYWLFCSEYGTFKAFIYINNFNSHQLSFLLENYLNNYIYNFQNSKNQAIDLFNFEKQINELKNYQEKLSEIIKKEFFLNPDSGIITNYKTMSDILFSI